MTFSRTFIAASLVSLAALQGCATSIKATSTQNPPPASAFNSYSRIEVRHAVFKDGVDGSKSALEKIDGNIQTNLKLQMANWNAGPDNGRKLVIEPVVEELSFKGGAKRVLLGPLAGSSGVLLRLHVRDAQGKEIASPEFFQRADAWAAGFIFGVHDNLMLTRVSELATTYVVNNYPKAVGGQTGADDKSVVRQ